MKQKQTKKHKAHHYHAAYLFVAIALLLLIEAGFMSATPDTIQTSTQILDMSSAVKEVGTDLVAVTQPMIDTVTDINQFYQLATTAMMQVLDLSDLDPTQSLSFITDGVNSFYDQASTQMAEVLDLSNSQSWPARVAGVSIEVSR
jgi:hypothetical protein